MRTLTFVLYDFLFPGNHVMAVLCENLEFVLIHLMLLRFHP